MADIMEKIGIIIGLVFAVSLILVIALLIVKSISLEIAKREKTFDKIISFIGAIGGFSLILGIIFGAVASLMLLFGVKFK